MSLRAINRRKAKKPDKIRNSKSEIRKQIQMTKKTMFQTGSVGFNVLDFSHFGFVLLPIVSDFDIRISDLKNFAASWENF
jgi:hypothetical protein